jgi:purine-nucleoside phosphorylase
MSTIKSAQPTLYDRMVAAAASIESAIGGRRPSVGLILGSGLGSYADGLAEAVRIDYSEIPGFPRSTVSGHAGRLVVGDRAGVTCAAMQGRVHYYEGHSAAEVAFPARTLIQLGCRVLIITNAAGGLRHQPGTLMLIRDHLNLLGDNPLRGDHDERFGARFPDMSAPYDPDLRALARRAAAVLDLELAEGVYASLAGPSYETPAEVAMLAGLGADAVGMSTVPEVIVANQMGARVLGISCITNQAAGLSPHPLSHAEVKETAAMVQDRFEALLDGILEGLAPA